MVGNLISMFMGFVSMTREKTDEFTNFLTEKGELHREEARRLAESLIEKGESERNALIIKMFENIESFRKKIVTKQDVERLEKKIDTLNKKLKSKQQ